MALSPVRYGNATLMTQRAESARPSFCAQVSEVSAQDFRLPVLVFYKIDSANQALMNPEMEERLSTAWAAAPGNKSLLLISKSG